jgi:hypothetical protein
MEFELEPKESYYGTYVDDIITGSITLDKRGLVGSVVSGNLEWIGEVNYSNWYYKKVFPWYRSGNVRGVKLFDQKTIYDSLVPDFTQITRTNGAKIIAPKYDDFATSISYGPLLQPFETKILKIILTTSGSQPVTASDGKTVSDTWWLSSYPFQKKYSNIPRLSDLNKAIVTNDYEEIANLTNKELLYTAATFTSSSNTFVLSTNYGNQGSPGWTAISFYDKRGSTVANSFLMTATLGLQKKEFLTGYYGFDLRVPIVFLHTVSGSNPFDIGVYANCYYWYALGGIQCRGWKYGLYSGIPTPANCVFRTGKYGQLRDMLEQRLFTKTIDLKTNAIISPITVQFVSGTEAYVTASNSSLNTLELGSYDFECRSGLPFFDI